jgi:hypothetical protein
MSTPIRHDDLDELRRRNLAVPALFRRGAWLTLPLGAPGRAPGRTATQILVWLPVRADGPPAADTADVPPNWTEVEAAIGARRGPTARTIPAEAAALWDGAPAIEHAAAGDVWTIEGAECSPAAFGNVFWKHGWAVATSAGVLVSLVNQ